METVKSMVEEVAGPSVKKKCTKKGAIPKSSAKKIVTVDASAKKTVTVDAVGNSDLGKGKDALNPIKIEVESDDDNTIGQTMERAKKFNRAKEIDAKNRYGSSGLRNVKKVKAKAKAVNIKQPTIKVYTKFRNGKKVYRWYIIVKKTTEKNVQHFPAEIIRNCLRVDQDEITIADCDLRQKFKCTIETGKRLGEPSPFERYMTKGWYDFVKYKGLVKGDILVCQMDSSQPRMYVAFSTKYGRRIVKS